ncbi:MAG: hypothetical protein K0Q79_2186 [Flavipsychrobacter sp.]|jgi:hypothetical protein|nr:hypothetical protein [Flavipsychrobacter sp.]
MRSLLSLLTSLFAFICHSQTQNWDLSKPVDIKETGVNKVLCMKNGNTMLLHFEINKQTTVKIFDSTHKEIASEKHIFSLLDATRLQDATFKGLHDINGEAVLFIEQERLSKYVLIRLRFDGSKGTLIEEKIAGESQAQSKRMQFFAMKNREEDGYAIFFCTDVPQFKESRLNVAWYNSKHDKLQEVPLTLNRKEYDGLEVIGAEWQPAGICITLNLRKQLTNATNHEDVNVSTSAVYGNNLHFFHIPKGATTAMLKVVDVGKDIYPFYSNYTYNPYAQSLNQFVLSYREYLYRFGTELRPAAAKASLFVSLDAQNMGIKYKWVRNEKANFYYRQQTDSTKLFEGLPVFMNTNENGLSTVIFRSFDRSRDIESYRSQNVSNSYLGNFCITQFDDEGNELWGAVLPAAQFTKSYQHFYFADELAKKWQTQSLFNDLPEQVYNRQFLSQNVYAKSRNFYIVYNDYDKNFNNSIAKPGDTVYNFGVTNACYYKMDRQKNITKHYLFGEPAPHEYRCSFIEGADFDEQRGVYVTLVQYRKGENQSLRMGWAKLE